MSKQDMARPLLSKHDDKQQWGLSTEGTLPCDPPGKQRWEIKPECALSFSALCACNASLAFVCTVLAYTCLQSPLDPAKCHLSLTPSHTIYLGPQMRL